MTAEELAAEEWGPVKEKGKKGKKGKAKKGKAEDEDAEEAPGMCVSVYISLVVVSNDEAAPDQESSTPARPAAPVESNRDAGGEGDKSEEEGPKVLSKKEKEKLKKEREKVRGLHRFLVSVITKRSTGEEESTSGG